MILIAGLSPAWQQIMRFDSLRAGEVNRAAEVHWCASGKVINVALALARLGAEAEIVSLAGGATGAQIQREMAAAGVSGDWIATTSPTRVCTTLLDDNSHQVTELVENTSAANEGELQEFRDKYAQRVPGADFVVLTGSLPLGAPADFYRQLLTGTHSPALLDFRGPELLTALECRPLLVKPNREELARTVGRTLPGEEDVFAAAAELQRQGAQWVAISNGGEALLVAGPGQRYRVQPPLVTVINPIGSGDCLAAGIAWGLAQGCEMPEAIVLGVAAAAENAASLLPAEFDSAGVRQRAATIRCDVV